MMLLQIPWSATTAVVRPWRLRVLVKLSSAMTVHHASMSTPHVRVDAVTQYTPVSTVDIITVLIQAINIHQEVVDKLYHFCYYILTATVQ
jgi:hypothetical protein